MTNPDRNSQEHQGLGHNDAGDTGHIARPSRTSLRGFAGMDEAKQREIASKGGHSVPAEQRSFSKDHALASEAGRKGGQNVPSAARSFSKNRALASAAGQKGAQARNANRTNTHSH
jgi:hypothetical protein